VRGGAFAPQVRAHCVRPGAGPRYARPVHALASLARSSRQRLFEDARTRRAQQAPAPREAKPSARTRGAKRRPHPPSHRRTSTPIAPTPFVIAPTASRSG